MTRTILIVASLVAAGCSDCSLNRMVDQPRYTSYEACDVCPEGTIMMLPPAGTVARGIRLEEGPATGTAIPIALDRRTLERGRDRFDIYCAACHGRLGDGSSEVARAMELRKPPSLLTAPYRAYSPARIFNTITDGFGLMRSYRAELSFEDRWAVVAYLKALQLSQHVAVEALPAPIAQEARRWLP